MNAEKVMVVSRLSNVCRRKKVKLCAVEGKA